eukprot:TRINITY_DN7874_c0_g1_i1.p1 TRINITY_DN7874_c0_g1~~TRINITY_DN7874_c0_g1_i1.p1  ORF type:complete len:126 (+),score=27.28 TRINITY_DN7874_c0_g1_i1:116-493(+)
MSARPKWVDDNTVTKCKKCKEDFTLLNRRHHCRGCGKIFCGGCTSRQCSLPETFDYSGPERVCDKCFDKWATAEEKENPSSSGFFDGHVKKNRETRLERRKRRRERLKKLMCIGGCLACCCYCCL